MIVLTKSIRVGGRGLPGRRRRARRLTVLALLATFVATFLLRSEVVEPVRVSSGSMRPTLTNGEVVLVQKLGYGALARRQLVAFDDPVNHALTVKRVVAVAGDTVEIRDAVLHINDQPVPEPAVDYQRIDGLFFGPAKVPPATVFLMGDNRGFSIDSRNYGPIPVDAVSGRIALRLWPPSRLH